MRHIVAYSGGLSSFEVARLLVSQFGPQSVECVFTDTLTEDEDLYRFLDETINHLGVKLHHISYGMDIWGVFTQQRFHGNSRIDTCSKYLKRGMFREFLKGVPPRGTILYYGIGTAEAHRLPPLIDRWAPFEVRAPLVGTDTTNEHILLTLDQLGIAPPRLYEMGFEHNNCGGFCVKTGQRQMSHLLKVMPSRYAHHERKQEELFKLIGKHGFIKRATNGVTEYLTLKEFREWLQAGGNPQLYQEGACNCF